MRTIKETLISRAIVAAIAVAMTSLLVAVILPAHAPAASLAFAAVGLVAYGWRSWAMRCRSCGSLRTRVTRHYEDVEPSAGPDLVGIQRDCDACRNRSSWRD